MSGPSSATVARGAYFGGLLAGGVILGVGFYVLSAVRRWLEDSA